jgi:pyridoxal phosphate enzyme (YggS family)
MTVDRDRLERNVAEIRERIAAAAARSGRPAAAVALVAATKNVEPEPIGWAVEAGITALGENYAQELRRKRAAIPGAAWHFIGTLQSGTARLVADHADVVETLAGERAARRLAARADRAGRTLDALIEVDLTDTRAGVPPAEVDRFAELVATLDGLRLVGVMTVPPLPVRAEDSRPYFARLRELRDALGRQHADVLETSMGMSLDYEVAVEEGATMVRVGTALFGPRTIREEPT